MAELTREEYLSNLHPGTHLREDYLPDLGWTPYRLAKEIGITQSHLAQILRNEKGITANLALRLGRLFNQSPQMWLRMQGDFDLEVAKDRFAAEIEKVKPQPMQDLDEAA
ncbi:MAG: HigA family addiction module antitoxin [Capsulimonadaceae bacterium]|nr:HigA family addiction module antitoxin [Capsulimonadaceae bacterium]